MQARLGLRMSSEGGGEKEGQTEDPYVVPVRTLPPCHPTSPVIKPSWHQLSRTDQIVDFQTRFSDLRFLLTDPSIPRVCPEDSSGLSICSTDWHQMLIIPGFGIQSIGRVVRAGGKKAVGAI